MKFRSEITLREAPFEISTELPALLLGSCFSDNVGEKMKLGWSAPVFANPCGVIYNPLSIARLLNLALSDEKAVRQELADSLTQREGKWVSWLMDSKTKGDSREEAFESALEKINLLADAIRTSEVLIVTFGTPWVYLRAETGSPVGNCHKHPQVEFTRRRLSFQEIVSVWSELLERLRAVNPALKVVFTVSPMRYLGEGFAGNSCLKAILLLACEELCSAMPDACYFPAFEIVNDDLRDYRFYSSDLIHPSPQAVDYIWEKFSEFFLSSDSLKIFETNKKERLRLRHRPIM